MNNVEQMQMVISRMIQLSNQYNVEFLVNTNGLTIFDKDSTKARNLSLFLINAVVADLEMIVIDLKHSGNSTEQKASEKSNKNNQQTLQRFTRINLDTLPRI